MMRRRSTYIHGQDDAVWRSHRWRTADNSAAYLVEHLRPGLSVLDIGCGQGTVTADLADLVSPGLVTGVDSAREPLAEAARVAADRGRDNTAFALADVHALPYADAAFDVVHAHQVLQHVADPVDALREMRRVCAPGGVVAARDADYAAMTWYPEIPALEEWRAVYRRVARANAGEPDAARRLLSWARRAGFERIDPTASTWCFATPEDRAWWGNGWAGRMRTSAIADHAVAGGHATTADLRRIAEAWQEWAAAEDGWFAVLHGEILGRA